MSVSTWLLDPTTPHRAVSDHVRRRWRQVENGEYEVCIALRRLFEDNLHRHEGFSRFVDFAERRFGIRERLAGSFLFLAKHLKSLPKTRAALESGDLSYTKAREFVTIATPDDEARWIDFANSHTNRDLERECRRARRGTVNDVKKIVSRAKPAEVQTLRKARETLAKKLDRPVPEAEFMVTAAKCIVNGTINGENGPNVPVGSLKKPTPYLTINLCPQCTHTYVPVPGENLRVPVSDWYEALKNGAEVHDLVADLVCECEDVKHRRDLCPNRQLVGRKVEPPKNRHIPADVRRHIEARDGHRCRVPGCGCAVPLEQSHLKPFRNGTAATPENLAMHCATCNDLIESGRVVIEGEAPLEKYYRAGEFVGYGFDPAPHVGGSLRTSREDGCDPPGASSAAD